MNPTAPPICGHDLLSRLHKIEGQVRGIQAMVAGDAKCVEVLTQISAARAALAAVGVILLEQELQAALSQTEVDALRVAGQTINAAHLLIH